MAHSRSIKREILSLLEDQNLRYTPIDLERAVDSRLPGASKRTIRNHIKGLLNSGRLIYTQHFSTTHLEINYNRPFQVSDRIHLSPSNFNQPIDNEGIQIRLHDGSSFGAGDHPTTRMILRAMDHLTGMAKRVPCQALDIGTGSGVLAIAAAALGVRHVEAVDIDPMACHEAIQNVALNGYAKSIKISQTPLDEFKGKIFDLILANLRPPTIRQMIPLLAELSNRNAIWVISGCRESEMDALLTLPPIEQGSLLWKECQGQWSAFAVKV